jgi:hypothetical protein
MYKKYIGGSMRIVGIDISLGDDRTVYVVAELKDGKITITESDEMSPQQVTHLLVMFRLESRNRVLEYTYKNTMVNRINELLGLDVDDFKTNITNFNHKYIGE